MENSISPLMELHDIIIHFPKTYSFWLRIKGVKLTVSTNEREPQIDIIKLYSFIFSFLFVEDDVWITNLEQIFQKC